MRIESERHIDRESPAKRPVGRSDGTQEWRDLVFLHWTIPSEALRQIVPRSLEIDLFENQAFLGIVPFAMRSVRPKWWSLTRGFNFLEANLRTYVVYRGQPGVYFFSLEAASWLAVQAARWGWSLPYYYARMATHACDGFTEYHSRRRNGAAQLSLEYSPGKFLGPSKPGTVEHFLLERYLLFVERSGKVKVGQVHHRPYEAYEAHVRQVEETLTIASSLPRPNRPPEMSHFCPGVDVEVFALKEFA